MSIAPSIQTSLEEAFEQNLASYIDANATSSPSDFKVKRELDIARHALEESLTLHKMVTTMLKTSIAQLGKSQGQSQGETPDQTLFKLISLANNLEERHRKLQSAAKTVASIAKQGAEIESLLASKLDAAQVYSIIVQLPALLLSLVETSVKSYLDEHNTIDASSTERIRDLSNLVANRFNEEVERSVNVLTYGGSSSNNGPFNSGPFNSGSLDRQGDSGGGISVVEEQVVAMLNTVPLGTVVESDSPEADAIRRETGTVGPGNSGETGT